VYLRVVMKVRYRLDALLSTFELMFVFAPISICMRRVAIIACGAGAHLITGTQPVMEHTFECAGGPLHCSTS
jgi:hypothetical protein